MIAKPDAHLVCNGVLAGDLPRFIPHRHAGPVNMGRQI